jgi:ribosomal protein S18 acetylase RimI-like enzyme
MVEIRRMESEDTAAVSEVLCSCYRWLAKREGYTPAQVAFLLGKRGSEDTVRAESREQLYLVACVDGTLAGMVSVGGKEVTKLYVEPSRHCHGIGTKLLAAAEAAIREAGFDRMLLGTTPGTVPFYESMGMAVAGTRRPTGGPFTDRDVVIMEKRLPGPGVPPGVLADE